MTPQIRGGVRAARPLLARGAGGDRGRRGPAEAAGAAGVS